MLAVHANSAQVILSSDNTGDVFYGTPSEMDIAAQPCADPLTPLFSIGSGGQKLENGPNNIHEALARAHNRGALFAAAQMLGVAQAALDITVEYSKERQQFGRPIGGNQAVKHLLAEVQVGIEFLRPVVYAAAAMLANGNQNASAHISHARLRAAEVVQLATERAIQVHGAMGYSWEADVHLFLKRGMVLARQWGTTDQHFDRVAERAIQSGELASDKLFGT